MRRRKFSSDAGASLGSKTQQGPAICEALLQEGLEARLGLAITQQQKLSWLPSLRRAFSLFSWQVWSQEQLHQQERW
jgi:hypothetical protein